MRMVRSSKAHGKILSVDASAALKMPGVVAVWTNDDIADLSPIDFRADKNATGIREFRQPALAKTYVRYIGDPVAAVFADDPYVAEDAAEQVMVEIEDLPVVVSASDPPGEFEPGRSSEAIVLQHSFGDIEAAFRNAHAVVELDSRPAATPACHWRRAAPSASTTRRRICWSCTARRKSRTAIARRSAACSSAARRRCTCTRAMSAAASASAASSIPRTCLVLVAAMRFNRPVKWIEDRREHLMCANQGREQRHLARIAVDKDGHILGIEDEIFHDQGAYIRTHGVNVPNRTMCMMTGAYKVPAYRARGPRAAHQQDAGRDLSCARPL